MKTSWISSDFRRERSDMKTSWISTDFRGKGSDIQMSWISANSPGNRSDIKMSWISTNSPGKRSDMKTSLIESRIIFDFRGKRSDMKTSWSSGCTSWNVLDPSQFWHVYHTCRLWGKHSGDPSSKTITIRWSISNICTMPAPCRTRQLVSQNVPVNGKQKHLTGTLLTRALTFQYWWCKESFSKSDSHWEANVASWRSLYPKQPIEPKTFPKVRVYLNHVFGCENLVWNTHAFRRTAMVSKFPGFSGFSQKPDCRWTSSTEGWDR